MYISGARGVDPNAYKIHKVVDDQLYELARDGKVVLEKDGRSPKLFFEENLQMNL